jgi:hypothetical protein
MQHAEFRRLFGADPRRSEPQVLEHRAHCAECARYAADLERVDALLSQALNTPAAPQGTPPWELAKRTPRTPSRWYAMAAGTIVVLGLAAMIWLHQRRIALFDEVVLHAAREQNVMVASEKRVAGEKVRLALAKAGARMRGDLPVSTARTCKIRGVVAPHLIMQTEEGAVALLLLTEERLLLRHSAVRQGYAAKLVPVGDHSIAVVGTSDAAVASGAEMASRSIYWLP